MRTASGAPGSTGAGPSSSGASNSEVTVAKLPAGHDRTRAAATHRQTVTVSAIGLGAMPLSTKEHRPSPAEAEAVVHAALDAGVTLIDTADAYAARRGGVRAQRGAGRQRAALVRPDDDVLVATKGGHTRPGTDWGLDGSPAYLRRACEASLRRLHVDAIGLYQFHRPDPATPWEESMGALRVAVRRRAGADGRHLERRHRPDRRRPGDRRRRAGERAEPVLAGLPLLGRRAGALRRARARLAAVEPVRRGVGGRVAGRRRRRRSRRWPTSSASRSTG